MFRYHFWACPSFPSTVVQIKGQIFKPQFEKVAIGRHSWQICW